ncbi:MAG TPA: exonuclease domain-containing protein [Microbacteriaceae bacterium]|nr:exonuclease domain-containing protein [Microbacteriaceae bacterium]
MQSWADRLGVFDVETTGVNVDAVRIVSAHVGVLDADGRLAVRHDWLVDPGVEIPPQAQAVHGISTERAKREGMPAASAVGQIVETLARLFEDGVAVTAYNAPYDFTVLDREAARYGIAGLDGPRPVIDPLVIDRQVDKYRRGKRTLQVTCEHYGVALDNAHDASSDAAAAGRLAQELARRFPQLVVPATQLHDDQVAWSRAQAEDFEAYMRRVKDPSFRAAVGWPVR